MRKYLVLLLVILILLPSAAWATTTTNFGFLKPAKGDSGDTWVASFNTQLDSADAAIKSALDGKLATGGNATSATLWGAYATIAGPSMARTYTFPDSAATMVYQHITSILFGTASSDTGSAAFYNSGNANAFTIQPGATGAPLSWTLPIAAPGGNNYLVNASTAGVLGYTNPSTFLPSGGNAASATYASGVTTANSINATSYLGFVESATGNLGLKTNSAFTINASTGALGATTFVGAVTGTASGNVLEIITSNPTTGNYTPYKAADTYTAPAGGLTIYQLVYQTGVASVLGLAKSDSATTMRCIGMATATVGASASVVILSDGLITNSGWTWTPGAELYVSEGTAGLLTSTLPASGNQAQVVARAKTATTIVMIPNQTMFQVP